MNNIGYDSGMTLESKSYGSVIAIELPAKIVADIQKRANERGLSISDYIRFLYDDSYRPPRAPFRFTEFHFPTRRFGFATQNGRGD